MKIITSLLLMLLCVFITIFVGNWVFNHINAWIGLCSYALGGLLTVYISINQFKNLI